jgi:hypothetical protein
VGASDRVEPDGAVSRACSESDDAGNATTETIQAWLRDHE